MLLSCHREPKTGWPKNLVPWSVLYLTIQPWRSKRCLAAINRKWSWGRWLDTGRRLLIAEDPTAGVDVGAKAEIYHLLFAALASGMGVLIVSTDFEEVASICHRAIVFSRGKVVSELRGVALSTETLIQAASAGEEAA